MVSAIGNKTAVIFGASSGIGAAVARRFGALGADVIVHYSSNKAGAEDVVRKGVADLAGKASADATRAKLAELLLVAKARLMDEL